MEAEAASSGVRQPPHSQAKEDRTPEQSKLSKVNPPNKTKMYTEQNNYVAHTGNTGSSMWNGR